MSKKEKTDELLSAFMDEALSTRRRTEMKRLLKHDPQLAARLADMRKRRDLVRAIPPVQAPESIVEQIKGQLERRTLVGSSVDEYDEVEGAKHLLGRRILSAAAIITLAAVLSVVVYTIVSSPSDEKSTLAANKWVTQEIKPVERTVTKETKTTKVESEKEIESPAAKPQIPQQFAGRLEILTSQFTGVDAFVKRSLLDSGIVLIEFPVANHTGQYQLRCGRKVLNTFLADLSTIWDKFDSTNLYLLDNHTRQEVIVKNVTAEQIETIAAQSDINESLKLARSTAALNEMVRELSTTELLVGNQPTTIDTLPIPKPVLTSNNSTAKTASAVDPNEIIELTIQVKINE